MSRSLANKPDKPGRGSISARGNLDALRPRERSRTTSQGHPRTTFRRALERGNLVFAESEAHGACRLDLREALELDGARRARRGTSGRVASAEAQFDPTADCARTRRLVLEVAAYWRLRVWFGSLAHAWLG